MAAIRKTDLGAKYSNFIGFEVRLSHRGGQWYDLQVAESRQPRANTSRTVTCRWTRCGRASDACLTAR
jgi:hypothetical protein